MLLSCFHPLGRQIDLAPPGAAYLARPASGQDRKLHGERGGTFAAGQVHHELGNLTPLQRREISDRRDLVRIGQQVLQMAAPPGRIFALPIFADGGPVDDAFDPSAQAHGRFCLGVPDWPENLHDEVGIDVGNRQGTEHRRRVVRQRALPLCGVLGALPAAAVGADVRCRALVERLRSCRAQRRSGPVRIAGNDRILAFGRKQPAFSRPLPRYAEADCVQAAQPHLARPAGQSEPKHPALRSEAGDLQPKPVAVAVMSWRTQLANDYGGEFFDFVRHETQ